MALSFEEALAAQIPALQAASSRVEGSMLMLRVLGLSGFWGFRVLGFRVLGF